MQCSLDYGWLQEYIEDTLEPLEKLVLQEHLKSCDKCRKELTELKLLLWEMEEMSAVPLPDEAHAIKSQVLNTIRETVKANENNAAFDIKSFFALQRQIIHQATFILKVMPGMKRVVNTSKKSAVKGSALLKNLAITTLKGRTKTLLLRG